MSVAQMQADAELDEALKMLDEAVNFAGGFSWHQDALIIVRRHLTAQRDTIDETRDAFQRFRHYDVVGSLADLDNALSKRGIPTE